MARTAVVGGLLSGLGRGLVNRAEQEREDVLLMRKEAIARAREIRQDLMRQQERSEDREFRAAENEKDREFRRGLLSQIEPDQQGNLYGVTAAGETQDLGIRAPTTKAGSALDGGMSAGDQRLWNIVKDKYTSKDLEGETVDWESVAKELRDVHGRPDLAKLAQPMEDSGSSGVDVDSAQYREAQRMADEWISGKAGLLRSDKTDFAKYGGNREEARQAKTLEFYRQLTGGQQDAAPEDESRSAVAASPPAGDSKGRGKGKSFSSPEQVRDAFKRGELTRDEALRVLRAQFGMQ